MARYIIKAHKDHDAYLMWSTIVDRSVQIGTREEFVREYGEEEVYLSDKYGTSARWFENVPPEKRFGGWDNELVYVCNNDPKGYIPRERLLDVYRLLEEDPNSNYPYEWFSDILLGDEGISIHDESIVDLRKQEYQKGYAHAMEALEELLHSMLLNDDGLSVDDVRNYMLQATKPPPYYVRTGTNE